MTELADFQTYKIGQAAKLLGVKPYVLRFWEDEFEALRPIRSASVQRRYTKEQIELVRRIMRLLYEEGLTIEGARRRLAESDQQDLLRQVRDELAAIRDLVASPVRAAAGPCPTPEDT